MSDINQTCQNCGAHVSERFVRVFAVDESEGVEGCPRNDCGMVRDGNGRVREPSQPQRYESFASSSQEGGTHT